MKFQVQKMNYINSIKIYKLRVLKLANPRKTNLMAINSDMRKCCVNIMKRIHNLEELKKI